MDQEKVDSIRGKITDICDSEGLSEAAFCATTKEGELLGMFGVDKTDPTHIQAIASVLNIGRLWQSGREKFKQLLDTFDELRR